MDRRISPGSDSAFTQFVNGAWTQPYNPEANRARTSVQSLPSKGAPFVYPPDLTDGKVYQDEWVAYLRSIRPQGDTPPIYAMDNEPELWADNTHVDVHPVRLGYDDELSTYLTYARAVKKADPAALVMGPESWGVTGYLFSALDEGGDGYGTNADRQAHGNLPFVEWFLKAVSDSDKSAGSRSLDVFSVHYYPNAGEYTGGNDPATQDKRMQGPRALWDVTYAEPSWVARTEWANLALLPRLQNLIALELPGHQTGNHRMELRGRRRYQRSHRHSRHLRHLRARECLPGFILGRCQTGQPNRLGVSSLPQLRRQWLGLRQPVGRHDRQQYEHHKRIQRPGCSREAHGHAYQQGSRPERRDDRSAGRLPCGPKRPPSITTGNQTFQRSRARRWRCPILQR